MAKYSQKCAALLVLLALAGCESEEDRVEATNRAAADSIAEARARGETDLGNPEMGAKVLLTLSDSAIQQSHKHVPRGQVSFAIQNNSKETRIVEVKGRPIGNWTTFPIPGSGGYVVLSMVMDPGEYDITVMGRDTTATGRAKAQKSTIVATP